MNSDKVQKDVRQNKVKEGLVLKQSRHLKQWKQRWMVLTKTHLYTFPDKTQYKNPTQTIMLKDVVTLKSYYKDQYKPFTFRVESQQVSLHMCTRNSDQKWAWMTAIEKMIERVLYPDERKDSQNLIKQAIRASTAVRQTMLNNLQKKQNFDFSNDILKKMKLNFDSQTFQVQILPEKIIRNNFVSKQQETFFVVNKKQSNQQGSNKKTQKQQDNISFLLSSQQPQNNKQQKTSSANESIQIPQQQKQKVVQKIVQVRVEVPVQRVVERVVQRIVKVPEVRQKIIEKIIYKQSPSLSQNKGQGIKNTLKNLMMTPTQNPTPLVNFVIYLMTENIQIYQADTLQFCLDNQTRRFFAEIFLIMLNQQTNEQLLKKYLQFVLILYQNCDEYFYSSDAKALISIIIRQIQMNRSGKISYLTQNSINIYQCQSCSKWQTSLGGINQTIEEHKQKHLLDKFKQQAVSKINIQQVTCYKSSDCVQNRFYIFEFKQLFGNQFYFFNNYKLQPYISNPKNMKICSGNFGNSSKISQNFVKILNSTADKEECVSEQCDQIQYMKRFYQTQNSYSKLKKLINYYCNTRQQQRFLHPSANKKHNKNIFDFVQSLNPQICQKSSGFNFNFYKSYVLTPSIFENDQKSANQSFNFTELIEIFSSNKLSAEQNKSIKEDYYPQLNYIPYKNKQKFNHKSAKNKIQTELLRHKNSIKFGKKQININKRKN